jgi:branched-chain amino acid aminotransferase
MSTRVFLDGRVVPPELAMVSIFDRGFLYGDSVYEVMRTVRGRPLDLDAHLERLEASAATIALPLPDRRTIAEAIDRTLREAANPEAYIRVMATRGAGPINLDPASAVEPRLIIIVKVMELPPPAAYTDGVEVAIVSVQRNLRRAVDPKVKSGNYLNNVLALREAKQLGAYEALMCDHTGHLAEGSTSNFFFVKGGRLLTPPLDVGILEGITRRRVIELARRAGIDVAEELLAPSDVPSFEEVFLTSSVRGLVPVVRIDGEQVRDGAPGPVTRRIMALYAALLAGPPVV